MTFVPSISTLDTNDCQLPFDLSDSFNDTSVIISDAGILIDIFHVNVPSAFAFTNSLSRIPLPSVCMVPVFLYFVPSKSTSTSFVSTVGSAESKAVSATSVVYVNLYVSPFFVKSLSFRSARLTPAGRPEAVRYCPNVSLIATLLISKVGSFVRSPN